MGDLTSIIKAIQDIMRKDVGVDGDAQRIGQMVWMFFLKIFDDRSNMLTLLPLLASITMLVGILSILMGFVSELIVRTYYESQQKEIYSIKELINIERPH